MDPDTPVRSYMDDESIQWRYGGRPKYDLNNKNYLKGRSKKHPVDSLEKLVENLVKTWEMESTHKIRPEDWGCIDLQNYKFVVNGGRPLTIEDNMKMGNYNMLLMDSPLYNCKSETNESSHSVFLDAFPLGFTWELLEVFSGPPKVTFTWRHWAKWTGPYKGIEPTGEDIELKGSCVVLVNDDLKIQEINVFYDPNPMMAKLLRLGESSGAQCPVCRNVGIKE